MGPIESSGFPAQERPQQQRQQRFWFRLQPLLLETVGGESWEPDSLRRSNENDCLILPPNKKSIPPKRIPQIGRRVLWGGGEGR